MVQFNFCALYSVEKQLFLLLVSCIETEMNYVHTLEPTDPCYASNWAEFHCEVINRGISRTFVSNSVRQFENCCFILLPEVESGVRGGIFYYYY